MGNRERGAVGDLAPGGQRHTRNQEAAALEGVRIPPEETASVIERTFKRLRVLLVLIVTMIAWELSTRFTDIPHYLLPSPNLIYGKLAERPAVVAEAFLITATESVLGFAFAAVISIVLAIVIARSLLMEELLYPYLNIIRVTPTIAIAPLLTIWFGRGLTPMIIVSMLIAFFPMVVTTVLGLKSVEPDLINLMQTLNANEREIFRKIRMPNALPYIFSSFRISAPLAVIGALVGEFVGGSHGMGYLLVTARGRIDTSMVFLMVVLSALLGILFFMVVVALERRFVKWHPSVALD